MFGSVGWGEILVLLAAGLIILGPERLPGAISWSMKAVRRVRDYATGATDQLKEEFGPEFDDLRKPLADLNELRGMTPRAVVTRHLLDGDDSIFRLGLDPTMGVADAPPVKPVSAPVPEPTHADGGAATPDDDRGSRRRPHVNDWDAT